MFAKIILKYWLEIQILKFEGTIHKQIMIIGNWIIDKLSSSKSLSCRKTVDLLEIHSNFFNIEKHILLSESLVRSLKQVKKYNHIDFIT